MASAPHRVARLHVAASVADLDLAFGLRSRIERLAWEQVPTVIARVCDAVAPPDQHLRIARLDLDLGTVRPDHLEEDALAALERALSDALAQALHAARYSPSDAARLVDAAAMWVADFDRFLSAGRLPVARRDARFDAAARLDWLIAEQPEALTRLLVRRARDRYALERLVLQVGDSGFRALLALLAPRDADVILALLGDILRVHHDPPAPFPAALGAPALERVLRVATLEFLLRDPGTQFNRRRFLAHLLRREARAMGVDYGVLLRLLGDAVAVLRAHQGLGASLPQSLGELLAETGVDADAAQASADTGLDAAITAARAGMFDALLVWVRRIAGDRTALAKLVDCLSAALFAGLIERLDRANAALILAMLDDLTLVHRSDAELKLDGFEASLRVLTLAYLVRDPGTQFNRRQFLAFLIAQEAARAKIGYGHMLSLFADAVARLRSHQGLRGSLPAVLAELVDQLGRDDAQLSGDDVVRVAVQSGDLAALAQALARHAQDPDALLALVRGLPAPVFARLLRHLRPASATKLLALIAELAALPLALVSQSELSAWVRAAGLGWLLRAGDRRFDRRAWLNAVLAEVAARGGADVVELQQMVAAPGKLDDDPDALTGLRDARGAAAARRAQLRKLARDPVRLHRLAGQLDPSVRAGLLTLLDPRGEAAMQAVLKRFAARHRATALLDLDAGAFEQLLWTLAVAWQARRGDAAFDAAAFTNAIVQGIARFGGKRAADIAAALAVGDAAPPTANEPQRVIDQYLRGGAPRGAGRGLPAMLAADPHWLAMAIRRHARSAPAHLPAMVERLLRWLTPEELIECLAPGLGARAMRWADAAGGVDGAQWQATVAALLDGQTPPFTALPAAAGRRLDRIALLAHWLDHGATPWWSADAEDLAAALAELPQATYAELVQLFGDRGFAGLWRVVTASDPTLHAALFERLIPWAIRPRGALAVTLDRLGPRERLLALTRAAADVLAGLDPDLAQLADPPDEPQGDDPATPPAAAGPDMVDTTRLFAWLDGGAASATERTALIRHFALLADRDDPELRAWIDARRGDRRALARWAALLPVEALARLVRLLVPAGAQLWLDTAAMLGIAARRTATFGAPAPDPVALWTILLDLVAHDAPPTPVAGAALLVERLVQGDAERAERLRRDAVRLAQDGGHRAVAAALRRAAPPDPPVAAQPRARLSSPPARDEDEDAAIMPPETDDAIFIGNAGLVLFSPFLPTLFERLDLLTDTDTGPRIVDAEAMSRGVHLLQYLVDERCDAPEPELVLNKLLCGLPSAQPVAASFAPSRAELAICDGLVRAVISSWPILGNASTDALRETFLQREGRLTHGADRWNLRVQRKTVDVLVDQVPWSFSMVYHRWMGEAVHVTW